MDSATSRRPVIFAALCAAFCFPVGADDSVAPSALLAVDVDVDFGVDVGQNFGTLFEVIDGDGRLLAGAGFPGLYNTTCRNDRRTVQFFVRSTDDTAVSADDVLPRFSEDTGVAIGDLDGRLWAKGHAVDPRLRLWDPGSRTWSVPPAYGGGKLRNGDGEMHVGGGRLSFRDDLVAYDGTTVLRAPAGESIHHVYYAIGHLFCFHDRPGSSEEVGFTRICALPWRPGDPVPLDLSTARAFPTVFPHETTWAWGQLKGTVLTVTNRGTVVAFDGRGWRTLREQDGTSYQVYSMLTYRDRLLLGQYPDGSMHEFDGESLTARQNHPPPMPGVVPHAREAQSLALYRGELYVGVWPWGEVWRRAADGGEWRFVRRLFTRPPPTAAVAHPFEAEIAAANAASGTKRVINEWGQRVTSLAVAGDTLYLGTSNKGGLPRTEADTFIDDAARAEYGLVHSLRLPGHLSATVRWVNGTTRYRFVVTRDRMRVMQDGTEIASAPIDPADATPLRDGHVTFGTGIFGPLSGTLVRRSPE